MTLIEVVVAVAVLAIVSAATASLLVGAVSVVGNYRSESVAQSIASGILAEIHSHATSPSCTFESIALSYGPAAFYPMDDPALSGGVVADASGNGNNAAASPSTAFPSSSWDQPGPPCSGGSLFFKGSGYVTTPPPLTSGWSPGSQLTVEAWFNAKSSSFSNNPRIVANDHTDVDYHGFQLQLNGNGSCPGSSLKGFGTGFFDVGNGKSQAAACWSYPLTAGTWYFYVGTYNGQSVNAYIDGQLVASTPYAGGPVAAPGTESSTNCSNNTNPPVSIGYNPCYGGDHFNGNLADVAIYTTALTSAQIEGQYQAATGVATFPPSSPVPLPRLWYTPPGETTNRPNWCVTSSIDSSSDHDSTPDADDSCQPIVQTVKGTRFQTFVTGGWCVMSGGTWANGVVPGGVPPAYVVAVKVLWGSAAAKATSGSAVDAVTSGNSIEQTLVLPTPPQIQGSQPQTGWTVASCPVGPGGLQ